ncbi:MAG: phytanoyl-CoA dioxygenase family protein, partial [Aurantibacter sp.]
NILHRSDQNKSDHARWSLICCYNSARNDPYKESQHASYTPLKKVGAEAIRNSSLTGFDENPQSDWVSPESDQTIEKLKS